MPLLLGRGRQQAAAALAGGRRRRLPARAAQRGLGRLETASLGVWDGGEKQTMQGGWRGASGGAGTGRMHAPFQPPRSGPVSQPPSLCGPPSPSRLLLSQRLRHTLVSWQPAAAAALNPHCSALLIWRAACAARACKQPPSVLACSSLPRVVSCVTGQNTQAKGSAQGRKPAGYRRRSVPPHHLPRPRPPRPPPCPPPPNRPPPRPPRPPPCSPASGAPLCVRFTPCCCGGGGS